jgi:hypothetical protein
MKSKISVKWSPLNKDSNYEKSGRFDKMKIIDNNVHSLVLENDNINNFNGIQTLKENNKNIRDTFDKKLIDRQWTMQKNLNPFLENNYLKDLKNQEEFMTPKNSHLINK